MADEYSVTVAAAGEVAGANLRECLRILDEGKAVDVKRAEAELPLAPVVVFARRGEAIVGVGAIKRERREYAAGRAEKSGVPFDSATLELGYVAVDKRHRRHGLSEHIVTELLAQNDGTLFATTFDDRMKRVFRKKGFERRGREWPGRKGRVSLWIRDAERKALATAKELSGWVDYDRDKLAALENLQERITYFEWRVRRAVINPLERILATEISPTEESSALLIFGVSLCCAIEASGKFLTGGVDRNWPRFEAFIQRYMDPRFLSERFGEATYARVLWDHFRNGLAHGFTVCHGGFEGNPSEPYFKPKPICGVDTLEINPTLFFDDYAVAIERYVADLRHAKPTDAIAVAFGSAFESIFIEGK